MSGVVIDPVSFSASEEPPARAPPLRPVVVGGAPLQMPQPRTVAEPLLHSPRVQDYVLQLKDSCSERQGGLAHMSSVWRDRGEVESDATRPLHEEYLKTRDALTHKAQQPTVTPHDAAPECQTESRPQEWGCDWKCGFKSTSKQLSCMSRRVLQGSSGPVNRVRTTRLARNALSTMHAPLLQKLSR